MTYSQEVKARMSQGLARLIRQGYTHPRLRVLVPNEAAKREQERVAEALLKELPFNATITIEVAR